MEPFDEALDRRIWSMASSRFEWDNNLADVRRTRPGEFTEELENAIHQLTRADEDRDALYDISQEDVKVPKDDAAVPDFEEVLRNTHALGQELNQAIPTQDERSKRVRVVEREIKALKP